MNDETDRPEPTAAELSERRRKAWEASNADYYAMSDKVDALTEQLAAATTDNMLLRLDLGSKLEEIDRLKKHHETVVAETSRRFAGELASARAEAERARSTAEEALAQRVAFETLFRNMLVMLDDFRPPADPLPTRIRPADGQRLLKSLERELEQRPAPATTQ